MISKLPRPGRHFQHLATDGSSVSRPQQLPNSIEEAACLTDKMLIWNDPDLVHGLRHLVCLCQKQNFSLRTALNTTQGGNDNLLRELLLKGSHRVLSLLHDNLTNGWYNAGEIERTTDALSFRPSEDGISWGFTRVGRSCLYVGDFRYGQRHGRGKLHFASDWYYEGDFLNNQRHGYGVDIIEGPDGRSKVGIFIDDIYRGNPHTPVIPQPRDSVMAKIKRFF